MRLKQWVELKGRGELTRLHMVTGIAYTTICKLAADANPARYESAKLISAATGGYVSIAELCELPPAPPSEPRGKRSKRKREPPRRAPRSLAAAPAARA